MYAYIYIHVSVRARQSVVYISQCTNYRTFIYTYMYVSIVNKPSVKSPIIFPDVISEIWDDALKDQ